MGLDYAGLILENTEKGLVLSQVECPKAEKGTPEQINASIPLTDPTIYLRVKFSCDGQKIAKSEGGHDLVVMCDFSYSLNGKSFKKLGNPFQAKEGKWIGAKIGTFCTRPAIKTHQNQRRRMGGHRLVPYHQVRHKPSKPPHKRNSLFLQNDAFRAGKGCFLPRKTVLFPHAPDRPIEINATFAQKKKKQKEETR